VVHEERSLEEVNEAIGEVEEGKVDARVVFDMGVEEAASQPEGVLTEESERPSEQPTGELGEHSGPIPG
jgi:hypothetical protein